MHNIGAWIEDASVAILIVRSRLNSILLAPIVLPSFLATNFAEPHIDRLILN